MESLSPRQLRYIRKIWRRHKEGSFAFGFKRVIVVCAILAVASVWLSLVAGDTGQPPYVIWFLGFFFGLFYTVGIANLAASRLWPVTGRIIDWKKVEEIAT